jgi:hypothetical protein|tara:strand:+ start:137 stop:1123 length:987 start_codon:yes stop_codon:yes gene_type:complete
MASREEQEYSSQAPAGFIGDLLSGTIFPFATSFFNQQFENLGREDSSPFTYTGQRVADFDPREQLAMQLSDRAIGSYRPYLGMSAENLLGASNLARRSTQQFDPSNIDEFYNPFEEDVVQQTLRDINRRSAQADIGLRDKAISQGAFGGSRGRIAQEELARQTGRGAAEAVGNIRSRGFGLASQQAQNAFEQAQRRGLAGAQNLGNISRNFQGLAGLLPQLQQQDISRTAQFGGLGRGRSQSLMDLDYQNFVGQYNLPMNLIQNLGSLTASLGPLAGGYGYAGATAAPVGNYTPNNFMGMQPIGSFLPFQQGILGAPFNPNNTFGRMF